MLHIVRVINWATQKLASHADFLRLVTRGKEECVTSLRTSAWEATQKPGSSIVNQNNNQQNWTTPSPTNNNRKLILKRQQQQMC